MKLLPCPHCGSPARRHRYQHERTRIYFGCESTRCPGDQTFPESEEAEAAAAWNSREAGDSIWVDISVLREEREMVKMQGLELVRMREVNRRLNRRAQAAERAARQNVEACERAGVSFGRALAWWAFEDLKRRIGEVINPPVEGGVFPVATGEMDPNLKCFPSLEEREK